MSVKSAINPLEKDSQPATKEAQKGLNSVPLPAETSITPVDTKKMPREMLLKRLKRVSRQYEVNFQKLWKAVNTPEQDYYIKIEKELNQKDIALRKDLGMYY